jgi:hypothetical protein
LCPMTDINLGTCICQKVSGLTQMRSLQAGAQCDVCLVPHMHAMTVSYLQGEQRQLCADSICKMKV